jgi:hypothetical protein
MHEDEEYDGPPFSQPLSPLGRRGVNAQLHALSPPQALRFQKFNLSSRDYFELRIMLQNRYLGFFDVQVFP